MLLIEACRKAGIEIPAFCYYPGLSLQAACRMCVVRQEKMCIRDRFDRFQEELKVSNKGTTRDGIFSLEEVECIGACCWAPAIQVNYDFHDELKPDLVPGLLDGYRGRAYAETEGKDA